MKQKRHSCTREGKCAPCLRCKSTMYIEESQGFVAFFLQSMFFRRKQCLFVHTNFQHFKPHLRMLERQHEDDKVSAWLVRVGPEPVPSVSAAKVKLFKNLPTPSSLSQARADKTTCSSVVKDKLVYSPRSNFARFRKRVHF